MKRMLSNIVLAAFAGLASSQRDALNEELNNRADYNYSQSFSARANQLLEIERALTYSSDDDSTKYANPMLAKSLLMAAAKDEKSIRGLEDIAKRLPDTTRAAMTFESERDAVMGYRYILYDQSERVLTPETKSLKATKNLYGAMELLALIAVVGSVLSQAHRETLDQRFSYRRQNYYFRR